MKRCFILILAAALCLSGCGKQEKEASAQIFAMDTVMEIAAFGPQAEEAVSETESQIQELEKQLSRTLPDSDVSRINRNGTTPTTGIAAGTWALLEAALVLEPPPQPASRPTLMAPTRARAIAFFIVFVLL